MARAPQIDTVIITSYQHNMAGPLLKKGRRRRRHKKEECVLNGPKCWCGDFNARAAPTKNGTFYQNSTAATILLVVVLECRNYL